MGEDTIHLEKKGTTAIITINRPKALNALNLEVLDDLKGCLDDLERNGDIAVIVLTGAGEKAFVAGADISYMKDLGPRQARSFAMLGHQVLRTVEEMPQPVIAAINGFALGGGCELAISCDIRYASTNAMFGQPEVNLGVIPGFGGTQRLPRLVGKGMANELLFGGGMIDAQEARRIGLVNKVFMQSELMEKTCELAEKIGSRGPAAVRLCKQAVNNGLEMELRRACQYEADLFGHCFVGSEQKEGMAAFLEKRGPQFSREEL